MSSNYFATARNVTATVHVPRVPTPAFIAIAPAMLMDMQCLTAGMTMTPWQSAGTGMTIASVYEQAYRRACAIVAAKRSAERQAGKITFVTAHN
jgi:hypothetical protein